MDWKEKAQTIIWSDNTLQEKEDMINQLLDQRDEEIIEKLRKNKIFDMTKQGPYGHVNPRFRAPAISGHNQAIDQAISTIRENK